MSDEELQNVNTDEKKAYLREWAAERASGDPARLPIIREAKEAVRSRFGDVAGSGLGTTAITDILRNLRNELSRRVGAPAVADRLMRVAHIAALMAEEGLQELAISPDGDVVSMRRFTPSGSPSAPNGER